MGAVDSWWHRDVLAAHKVPVLLCLLAFVLTFLVTRTVTRLIRAGRGPFRDNVTGGGVHVHHAVPGLGLLVTGAFMAVAARSSLFTGVAAVLVGVGVSLVLDEFALILHLTDVYWAEEGRVSVEVVSLAAACLAMAFVGLNPVGVDDVGGPELAVRITGAGVLVVHGAALVVCVLKGKYRLALFGLFVPPIAFAGAVRLARPSSSWWRRHYSQGRQDRAARRAAAFDRRWEPLLRRLGDLVAGAPTPAETRLTGAAAPPDDGGNRTVEP